MTKLINFLILSLPFPIIAQNNTQIIFTSFSTNKRELFSYNPTTGTTQQILTTICNPTFIHNW